MRSISEQDCRARKFKEGDLVRFTLDDELILYGIGLVLSTARDKRGIKAYRVYWVKEKRIMLDYEICLEFLSEEEEKSV